MSFYIHRKMNEDKRIAEGRIMMLNLQNIVEGLLVCKCLQVIPLLYFSSLTDGAWLDHVLCWQSDRSRTDLLLPLSKWSDAYWEELNFTCHQWGSCESWSFIHFLGALMLKVVLCLVLWTILFTLSPSFCHLQVCPAIWLDETGLWHWWLMYSTRNSECIFTWFSFVRNSQLKGRWVDLHVKKAD